MPDSMDPRVAALVDREAIRDAIYRYARGIDRDDAELLRSAYWPEAIDERDSFTGTRDAFVAWVLPQLRRVSSAAHHLIGNILITLDGDEAAAESYFHAYLRMRSDGPDEDVVHGGRYLDRLERRGNEWRIIHRRIMFDYAREYSDSFASRKCKHMAMPEPAGALDVSFGLFGATLHR